MTLSERQRRILEFIRRYTAEKGYPPAIREIGQAVGISSTSVVNYNLNALERHGYITRSRDISRGIQLTAPEPRAAPVRIPIVGVIVASAPVPIPDSDFAMLGEDEVVELTRDIIADERGLYALEVRGNSMVDALIHDGDLVIMRHVKEAQNGDLVAVWLKDVKETTLKRFYRERDRVRLQPANPTMEPIYVHPANVEIQGKVVLVIRRLDRVA